MDDIRFYIPEGETVPTDLRLMAGDVPVTYERIYSGFRFRIYEDDEQKALEIAERITQVMRSEHADHKHGVSWRTESLRIVRQEERYRSGTVVDWKYRVRDSY